MLRARWTQSSLRVQVPSVVHINIYNRGAVERTYFVWDAVEKSLRVRVPPATTYRGGGETGKHAEIGVLSPFALFFHEFETQKTILL